MQKQKTDRQTDAVYHSILKHRNETEGIRTGQSEPHFRPEMQNETPPKRKISIIKKHMRKRWCKWKKSECCFNLHKRNEFEKNHTT